MKIQKFGGGLNTRQAPQMLQVDQATVLVNIDTETEVLTPVKKHKASGIFEGPNAHWFSADSVWVNSSTTRDYQEFQKKLYWTDGINRPQKQKSGSVQNLGIDTPTAFLTAVASNQPEFVEKFTAASIPGAGTPDETNHYILINVDSANQSDFLHFSISVKDTVVVLNQAGYVLPEPIVVKTALDPAPSRLVTIKEVEGITYGANGVEVYRLYKGTFYSIGNLANDTAVLDDSVHDISANAQIDVSKFGKIHGLIQYVYTHVNNVDGAESAPSPLTAELDLTNGGFNTLTLAAPSDSQITKTRIYRVGGFISTFSLVEEIDVATLTYVDTKGDTEIEGTILSTQGSAAAPSDLAFLTEAYAMLFAAQGSKLRFTPIGLPDSWPTLFFLNFDAPITGIANVTGGLLVFTAFKTHIVTGTGPLSLAQDILSSDQGCISHRSVQVREGTALWASTDGICASAGSLVKVMTKGFLGKISLSVLDSIIFDEIYYLLQTNGTAILIDYRYNTVIREEALNVSNLAIANDVLYGSIGTQLFVIHGSTENDYFYYKSPRFVEGSISEHKTYKKVYIYSEGDIIINILIDGIVVATKSLSGSDSHKILVPQSKQRGFYIEFELEGTGVVHEIEYAVGYRDD